MRYLLTGATGFIGSQVAAELLRRGHAVRGAFLPGDDRGRIAAVLDRLELAPADVFHAPDMELAALCEGVECCLHLAWYAVPGKYLSARENLDCVMGSQRLFLALGAAGCRRIVPVGSCFEYDFSYERLSETTPTSAHSLYAAAKTSTFLMGEQIAKELGVTFAWPRLFYLYGPNEDPHRLVPFIITSLLRGEPANATSGKQVRDFLHVEDVAAALAEIAGSDLIGPVNVGSGVPVTVRTVVETIARLLGREDLIRFGARPDNPTDPPFICANILKLSLGTEWKPRYDLATGLAQAISWWRTALGAAPLKGS